jgi:chromosome partitioning protein
MRGLRRDRDKASRQEKQDPPVEVEPSASEQDPEAESAELTVEPEPTPSAETEIREAAPDTPPESEAESEDEAVVVAAAAGPQPASEPEPEPIPKATIAPERVAAVVTQPAVVKEAVTNAGAVPRAETVATAEGDKDDESSEGVGQPAAHLPLPRIIAVANQKGGVGKTTTAVNLGAALAELDFRVLVIDLDPQGNATTGLGIDARNFERSMYDVIMRDDALEDCIEPTNMKNLFVAPATIDLAGAEIELVPAFSRELKLKRAIQTVIDDFDYVLIDCPPSLGLITVNGLAAAAEVLVPIQCEYYALEGLSQLLRNVHLVASNLNDGLEVSTIVLTMYDARTKLSDQVASEVREHFGAKVCRNVIPRTVRLSEAPSFGQPISVFDPTSRGAIAYRELAKEVSGGAS